MNATPAISGVELANHRFHDPPSLVTMRDRTNTPIGVWSEHCLDRTVVAADDGQSG